MKPKRNIETDDILPEYDFKGAVRGKYYMPVPDQVAQRPPVKWSPPRPGIISKFRKILDEAQDEKPIQYFLETNPVVLLTGLVRPHTAWVIPRPQFPKPQGGGCILDFIICDWSSIGPSWIIVELESPTRNPVTESGISAICNHAIGQINDCRQYIRDNSAYLRLNGWPEIHGKCRGVVVIGRRDQTNRSKQSKKLEAFRNQDIEVMSYDRLLEECSSMQKVIRQLPGNRL